MAATHPARRRKACGAPPPAPPAPPPPPDRQPQARELLEVTGRPLPPLPPDLQPRPQFGRVHPLRVRGDELLGNGPREVPSSLALRADPKVGAGAALPAPRLVLRGTA